MLGCFDGITGGRVSEIIRQESRRSAKKNSLPISEEDDKVKKFNEKYANYIDVTKSYEVFSENWEREQSSGKTPNLRRALSTSFSSDLLKAFFAKMTWGVLVMFSIAFFVFRILDYIKLKNKGTARPHHERWTLILCAKFFLCMVILSIGIQQMGMYSSVLGAKVKAALTTAIYKKMIIREAYGSKADVVALVAKDVEKLAEACTSLQYLWSGIFETAIAFAILFSLQGFTILPGFGLMCVFLPLQYWLGLYVAYQKKALSKVSSTRISLMEEIMRGIKLIKIYGWEASFFKNLNLIRAEEAKLLGVINRFKAAILGLIFCLPPLMCMVIFGTQEATGKIEPVVIFTTLSFFNTLRVPFSKLPKSLRDVLDGLSCLERIQSFLLEDELAAGDHHDDHNKVDSYDGILFENVSLSYGHGAKVVLNNVNINIPGGSLVMVAGPVASGKSNLLKAILGDLTINDGHCAVSQSKAYVPQTPWTALGTVRDNILFGKPYEEEFYKQVVHACALETDLELMADGDMTWIGERGGNLSGGQKQRIALARAAYSRADLYVLDSPLSAVDMYTCSHIFKHCIEDLMIAGKGTVVLATHQTELFSKSDHLIVMNDGKMMYNDKYSFKGIKHLFPNFTGDTEKSGSDTPEKKKTSRAAKSGSNVPKIAASKVAKKVDDVKPEQESVYTWYIMRIGVFSFIVATLVFTVGQTLRVYSDAWISTWTKRKFAKYGKTDDAFYIGMYALLVHVFLFMAFLRAFVWFHVGKVAATRIHNMSFGATLKAPMHFFHVTPIGKLLSYFSKDVDVIDDVLVDNVLMLQIFVWILILAIGLVTYNLPLFLAIVAALGVVYVYVVRIYIRTSVPLKVVSVQAQSEVIAHTAETLSGLAVVRAFRMQDRFLQDNIAFQSKSTVGGFSVANLSLWLAFRVDIIGCLLVIGCCLLAVLGEGLTEADAGLIVSNSFQILLFFSIMSRTMGEVHENMGSIDVARFMSQLEEEHQPLEEYTPPGRWPSKGEIQFEDVVMPYLPGKPPVLKGVTFSMRPGEKVGVVGRTGAGKSSLIVALYRLAEITEGRIHVDSVDASTVSLNRLRSSMAIIPQEPVMFGGTLRTNLDPFNEHDDKELLDVLCKCLLGPMVESSKDGLDAYVAPMGTNYSLGTQQLICLARAMLNTSSVLLLDEATAALDSDTNNAVQQVLKEHFSDRTIFTIAHRLDTVIDSDRILVMNAGVIAEYDTPATLLRREESIFRELCMNTGPAQFEFLRERANAAVSKFEIAEAEVHA